MVFRGCDLTDCFANSKITDRCMLLDKSIHEDCPFYKPGESNVNRFADISAYRYSVARTQTLEEQLKDKHEEMRRTIRELNELKKSLHEAKTAKNMLKNRIKKNAGIIERRKNKRRTENGD